MCANVFNQCSQPISFPGFHCKKIKREHNLEVSVKGDDAVRSPVNISRKRNLTNISIIVCKKSMMLGGCRCD